MEKEIHDKYISIKDYLDEKTKRLWAATEANAIGHGGVTLVYNATGIARSTIYAGLNELNHPNIVPLDRIRRGGGGRKILETTVSDFLLKLENLIEPLTRGDPESALRWTCKSVRKLAGELKREGIKVGHQTVAARLSELGYSLQTNKKCITDGGQHPDRNAQFEHINDRAKKMLKRGNPVISVDTKKKELIGNYKNNGKEWHKTRNPRKVRDHDFPSPDISHAHPYGVFDLKRNEGFVNVGSNHDTAQFAVASILAWWKKVGKKTYTRAKQIQIMADSGGSNGLHLRLWKYELQKLADCTGLTICVCHFPPGTSKWNKVEYRLFSFISKNWREQPLINFETIVNLIRSTTTETGLKVRCQLDKKEYPTKIKVSDSEMKKIKIYHDKFHGDWNYKIKPHKS
jgi:transposase